MYTKSLSILFDLFHVIRACHRRCMYEFNYFTVLSGRYVQKYRVCPDKPFTSSSGTKSIAGYQTQRNPDFQESWVVIVPNFFLEKPQRSCVLFRDKKLAPTCTQQLKKLFVVMVRLLIMVCFLVDNQVQPLLQNLLKLVLETLQKRRIR